jgi:hypothetical protein
VKKAGYLQGRFESTDSAGGIRLVAHTGESYELQALQDGGFIIFDRNDGAYRLKIDPEGDVGIGTDKPGQYKLAVNSSAAKPGGGSWSTLSDARLKQIQGDYRSGLSEVTQLNPVLYTYSAGNEMNLPTEQQYVGVVAQEVHEVIPEAVEENADGYLMVNNDPIIWAMVNAIKELEGQNQQLKAQNMELIQRLEVLERTMGQNKLGVAKELQE